MTYATISTWKLSDGKEADERLWQVAQEKYVPMNAAMGASQTVMVDLGKGESAIISLWPDAATRDAAAAKLKALRSEGGDEFGAKMTGEMHGPVRAGNV
jgi:hypothetical protein